MKTTLLILLGIGSVFACTKKTASSEVNDQPVINTVVMPPASVPDTDSLSYLALGDSYTIGQSVDAKDSFPFQLSARLKSYGLKQQPTIIAQTGWTTNDLIAAISASESVNKKFDIVTLLIGVNDQFQGLSQTDYRTKFIQLLNTAIGFAGNNKTHVFVLSIPDYGVTPFANGQEATIGPLIDQFNNINHEESTKAGVNYINITTISKQAANDNSLVASDGLHPSAQMYKAWVEPLSEAVIAGIKK